MRRPSKAAEDTARLTGRKRRAGVRAGLSLGAIVHQLNRGPSERVQRRGRRELRNGLGGLELIKVVEEAARETM